MWNCGAQSGQRLTAVHARKFRFPNLLYNTTVCVWMVKLRLSSIYLIPASEGSISRAPSITLRCVSMVKLRLCSDVFNVGVRVRLPGHLWNNSTVCGSSKFIQTVLKKYHKFGVGRNYGNNTPPSFLKPSAQKGFFFFQAHSVRIPSETVGSPCSLKERRKRKHRFRRKSSVSV